MQEQAKHNIDSYQKQLEKKQCEEWCKNMPKNCKE